MVTTQASSYGIVLLRGEVFLVRTPACPISGFGGGDDSRSDSCAPILQQIRIGAKGRIYWTRRRLCNNLHLWTIALHALQQLTHMIDSVTSVYAEIIEWQG